MIHHLSDVQSQNIGKNTKIWQFTIVLPNAIIGNYCNINCNVFIENDVIIGDNVTIKPGVQLWDGLIVDDNVFIGPNATFINDKLPRSKEYPSNFLKTRINKNASIGANSTILPNLTIGAWSFVGAGSVVTKNVNPFEIVLGNPARVVGYITKQKVQLNINKKDIYGNKYDLIDGDLIQIIE